MNYWSAYLNKSLVDKTNKGKYLYANKSDCSTDKFYTLWDSEKLNEVPHTLNEGNDAGTESFTDCDYEIADAWAETHVKLI